MKVRIQTDLSDFKYTLLRPIKSLKYLKLSKAMIYNTGYLINDNNNKFYYNSTFLTLDNGNYSASELASHLQAKISGVIASSTVSYNSNSYKYTIALPSSSTLRFDLNKSLSRILGFNSTSLSGTSFTSQNIINLALNPFYIIKIKEVATKSQDKDLFYCDDIIYNKASSGDILYYERDVFDNVDIYEYKCEENKQLSQLTIEILDGYNNHINFNGCNNILEFDIVNY